MSTRRTLQRGFTMIELAVTMSIFAVLVSVVFTNYRSFSSGAAFTNAAEDVVLTLREAQIYGVGSRTAGKDVSSGTLISCVATDTTGITSNSPFNCAYGVYFDQSKPGQYIIFIDKDDNGIYTTDEDFRMVNFGGKAAISRLSCVGGSSCATSFSATFKRPFPDAVIKSASSDSGVTEGIVTLANNVNSKQFEIKITKTGLVSMRKLP